MNLWHTRGAPSPAFESFQKTHIDVGIIIPSIFWADAFELQENGLPKAVAAAVAEKSEFNRSLTLKYNRNYKNYSFRSFSTLELD